MTEPVAARADDRAGADVRVRLDASLGSDDGVGFDPRPSADTNTRGDLHAGFDVGAVLDQRRRVDLRAVRDESATVDVLAVAQRLAVVVFDVDVVLTHDPLRSTLGFSRHV